MMITKTKFFIVTPCFNSGRYIEETILSVIDQASVKSNLIDLEYWIIDGGSTDETKNILKKYEAHPSINIISEKDKGMYHAIVKGFQNLKGDAICGYINAGDLLSSKCFEIVDEVFSDFKDIQWATGINTFYNEKSQIINVKIPYKYRSNMFLEGFYGTRLPCVQQESTFWRSSLMHDLNLEYLSNLKMAGDSYLWNHFSKKNDLYIIQAYLGGFKIHAGQLSENIDLYQRELKVFSKSKSIKNYILSFFDSIMWHAPNSLKNKLNSHLITYDHHKQKWSAR